MGRSSEGRSSELKTLENTEKVKRVLTNGQTDKDIKRGIEFCSTQLKMHITGYTTRSGTGCVIFLNMLQQQSRFSTAGDMTETVIA